MRNLHSIGIDIKKKSTSINFDSLNFDIKDWKVFNDRYFTADKYFTSPVRAGEATYTYEYNDYLKPNIQTVMVQCAHCTMRFNGILPRGKQYMHILHNPDGSHKPVYT